MSDKKIRLSFSYHSSLITYHPLSGGALGAAEGDFLEVRHPLEVAEALVDLFVREAADALGAELLDVEGGHHRAVDDGAAQRPLVDVLVAGEVAHEAAGEGVARARRVEDGLQGVGRDGEVRVERVRSVEVKVVAPAPEEGLAVGDSFDVVRVDVAPAEDRHLLLAEVAADHGDDSHVREETGRKREVRGRPAQNLLALPERRLDRVERHRTDNEQ